MWSSQHKIDPESEEAMAEVASELWPPSPYLFHVFSSRTGLWEERPFLRDGEAAGTIGDVGLGKPLQSAYWGQALYVLCSNSFILRISLSKDEYQVIRIPADADVKSIGKSEKGLYIAGYADDSCLKVWVLNESCHEHEWVLRHNKELRLELPLCYLNKQSCGP
ncbi:hypothetical protein BS78_04G257400 [Paspalum vaginatum]|uniref:F-box associated domain-containing protein n=1 Tax=Paspalum vaginatum TaxID=158149 RepID=A0A9W8CDC3_9POAL|nr:hypothetical protein BS78_K029500 [Paspalum vaginatum]KAJ1254573.1 hypothetical protein BS78_K029500 [Paspalum vaginatum]KAJ1280755.1 hypothetical protein BS78_04G257400 [Paspalum vaginatum]